jgi:hypothetical protein
MLWLWAFCCPPAGFGQKSGITPELHSWGRFSKGAWTRYRVIAETFDEHGAVASTSTTETKTTLVDVAADAVTLRVEAVVEIAGRQLDPEPKTVKQGFHGELTGEKVTVRDLGPGELVVEGRKIPCKIEEVEVTGPHSKTVAKVYYSSTVAPYVLKRESKTTDPETKTLINQTTFTVLSLDKPRDILRQRRWAAQVEAVATHPKGSTTTRAWTSVDVPGGLICHTAEESDAKGRLLRRSTLQLVAYGLDAEGEPSGLFKRVPRRGPKAHRVPSG